MTTPGRSPEINPGRFLDRPSQPFSGRCVSTHSYQRVKRCKESSFHTLDWKNKACSDDWKTMHFVGLKEFCKISTRIKSYNPFCFPFHSFMGNSTKVWGSFHRWKNPPVPRQNQLQRWEVTDPRAAKSAGGRDWLRRKRMHNAGVWASPGLRFYRKQRAWLANQKD